MFRFLNVLVFPVNHLAMVLLTNVMQNKYQDKHPPQKTETNEPKKTKLTIVYVSKWSTNGSGHKGTAPIAHDVGRWCYEKITAVEKQQLGLGDYV